MAGDAPAATPAAGRPVRATLHMRVKPGREGDFAREWKAVADRTREARGNLRQTLLRDPDDPRAFVITSDWVDRDAFTAFERSPEQDDLTAGIRALRESARMSVHEIVRHVDAGTAGTAGSTEGEETR